MHFLESIFTGKTTFITGGTVCSGWWEGRIKGQEEGYLMFDIKGNEFDWHYVDFGWEANYSFFSQNKIFNKSFFLHN